jgi:diacylglycerol kinase (ATP)
MTKKALRRAARQARLTAKLGATVLEAQRAEERQALELRDRGPSGPDRRRPALLIINTKSGPRDDSILRVREIVDELARNGVDAEVRVKLSKRHARREARRAARAGIPLVIAAGGDGTVEAVARGLIGREVPLGIVPLGTYNNLAASLGVPEDLAAACALIGTYATRAIDVGFVRTAERKKPRPFYEVASIGLAAALAPVGQEAKDGRWVEALGKLPSVLALSPSAVEVRLDQADPPRRVEALLLQVCNAPRSGAGLVLAEQARLDDGQLDLVIYRDTTIPPLVALFAAAKLAAPLGDRVETARARRVDVTAEPPLPVAADAKVVGHTPAEIEVRPGALLVIAGAGTGLQHPVAPALVEAAVEAASAAPTAEGPGEPPAAVPTRRAEAVERSIPTPARPVVRRLLRWLGP